MGNNEIESMLEELVERCTEDTSGIAEFIEEYEDQYENDLFDFAFRTAIRLGNIVYVEEYIDEIELNDEGDSSSYLYETDDENMQELLMDHGAYKSWDDYSDCKFAYETVNGSVLAFSPAFQKEVIEKYLEKHGISIEMLEKILEDDFAEWDKLDIEDELCVYELETMGAQVKGGVLECNDVTDTEEGSNLMEIIESLGWNCRFEGESWKFETLGVYFVK